MAIFSDVSWANEVTGQAKGMPKTIVPAIRAVLNQYICKEYIRNEELLVSNE